MLARVLFSKFLIALVSGVVLGVPIWMAYIGILRDNNPNFLDPFWAPALIPHSIVIGLLHGTFAGLLIGIIKNRFASLALAGLAAFQLTYYFAVLIWFPLPNAAIPENLISPYVGYGLFYAIAVTTYSFVPAVVIGAAASLLTAVLLKRLKVDTPSSAIA